MLPACVDDVRAAVCSDVLADARHQGAEKVAGTDHEPQLLPGVKHEPDRRHLDVDLEVESLTPIAPIGERIRVWKELTGNEIRFVHLDLAQEYDRFEDLLRAERPDALVQDRKSTRLNSSHI